MKKSILAIICACLLVPAAASAENIMRDYVPAPAGTMLNMLYYAHVTADTLNSDGNDITNDIHGIDVNVDLGLLREVYYLDAGPLRLDPQFILPFGNAMLNVGSFPTNSYSSSAGIGDLDLLCTIWFVHDDTSHLYLAYTPFFFLPTGDHDDQHNFGLGDNRYTFREEFAVAKGLELMPGQLMFLELQAGVDFFTTNDSYNGNQNMDEDPLFNLEAHVSYDVVKSVTVSGDYYGHWGGDKQVDDIDLANSRTTQNVLGVTAAFNFAPGWQFLLQYKQDVQNENAIMAKTFLTRLFYAFAL